MLLACCGFFCRGGAGVDPASAAVIAHIVDGGIVDDGLVVNVGNVGFADVIHREVVAEGSIVPISAFIADTTVAEAIVDATVEADMRAPVAAIPGEGAAAPSPITGGPEQAHRGRLHVRTRHPEVAFTPVTPVARRPQISCAGEDGLFIDRQPRWSDLHRYCELRKQNGRYGQDQKS